MPLTSIIIPCYNEAATIRLLLEAIRCQTYPLADLEVIIADGMSSDGTKQIVSEYQRQFPEMTIRWVENPKRIIPAALNAALRAARGEWVVRLDAHSVPAPDYVERCVNGLRSGIGDNVGGVWDIRPGGPGWIAQSIAVAAAHPLGAGDARYRYTSQAGEVDTVPFGSYRRDLFERIGFFDETLLTNEDYELNVRLRKSGGRIYLDPAIRTVYFARPN
ncbi:MAG TPA: glycosyltransferase family 2 protein, partial [Anaerolineaceae bacterium]|nr:glycosyltransferase family 2 protein [Anaerolineaceae bacterium]